jgi:hypothetical protein
VDDIWPKGLSGARVGSLVKRSVHVGEFGRLIMPDRIGIIAAISIIEETLVYDVLFLVGPEGEVGQFHTLRLFDEDLTLITL